ncbi:MAG: hypothetical protein WBD47_17945 [Phormidesmis sp.]
MSDTTAYLAGCATTGVAALVLLVARVGMVSANVDASRAGGLPDQLDRIEAQATAPDASTNLSADQPSQRLETEIRRELDKQRDLTQKLETQLTQQETLSSSLEAQLEAQEEKTQDLLARIQDYQRSVEDIELQDKIAAATQPAEPIRSSGPPASVIWLGAGVVVVLIIGGGGLILCAVLIMLQSQRRLSRSAPMPPQMPMPPASGYRYYDQTFLPPAQLRPRRSSYYDYPPSPYDYTP